MPNALAAASPSAHVRNVHELDSSNEILTRTEESVNLGRENGESQKIIPEVVFGRLYSICTHTVEKIERSPPPLFYFMTYVQKRRNVWR